MIDYTPKSKKAPTLFAPKYKGSTRIVSVVSPGYAPRETRKIPSLVTPGGSTAPRVIHQYTGSEMVGVSLIHKSCLQPIFNREAAKEVANMRR